MSEQGRRTAVTIVVTGDVTMDWNIAHVRRGQSEALRWNVDDLARLCWQRGGAALLADLAVAVASRSRKTAGDIDVRSVAAPAAAPAPNDPTFIRSFARWSPFPAEKGRPPVWRVCQFLGLDRSEATADARAQAIGLVADDTPEAQIVVLDDAGLGFRERADLWPRAIREKRGNPWIVLKMASPVAQGPLWDELIREHADRLIAVMTIDDLRQTSVQVSQRISWEQTAEDLIWELTFNPRVNGLSRCAFAVVSFDNAGAVLLSSAEDPPSRAQLLFDPCCMEGEWTARRPGGMIGNTAVLTTALVHALLADTAKPDLVGGIRRGIAATRRLFETGYDAGETDSPVLRFPLERVADAICEDAARSEGHLALAEVRPRHAVSTAHYDASADRFDGTWTILGEAHAEGLESVASEIVRRGLGPTLQNVPIASFGKLRTVDRREIEALRSIGELVSEYCDRPDAKPLSIAVFGPPGAGKSFAVKQVAAALRPGSIQPIVFNLSQLDGPEDLVGPFHQIRDLGLSGKIPLVFWDEFDASLAGQPLGWLRYFLTPMQDGEFQDGQLCHPIGRCIFVFAGGTSARMREFGAAVPEDLQRALKAPDFKSRLRGFLDVLGPDRQPAEHDSDPYFVIRRAILLRSLFAGLAPNLFAANGELRIDRGVLRALLRVERYRHGARSIETLLATSQLSGETSFERSCLPPDSQLDLVVDSAQFLAHVHELELEGALLERLARAIHESFCSELRASGYAYGAPTDDLAKTHSSLLPFEQLPRHEQEQNREVARDIPRKLACRGYVMMPNRRGAPAFAFSKEDLEVLAALEHRRWMDQKVREGWAYAPLTAKTSKLHADLVDFEQLSEKEKDKDRKQVAAIPALLESIGYSIVPLQNRGEIIEPSQPLPAN